MPLSDTESELRRTTAIVSEGMCPQGHGALVVRPLIPGPADQDSAGWCQPCGRGYSASRHVHDEDCAGPDMNEAHLWCPFSTDEPVVSVWERAAFVPVPTAGSRWCPGCGADTGRGQRCEPWCPTGRQGSGYG